MLAAMAGPGRGATFPPAQVQKLFFLIDTEIPDAVGGPHFNFAPYDYGPFDVQVYNELDQMQVADLIYINNSGRFRTYSLTEQGLRAGEESLRFLAKPAREFLVEASKWVTSLSFSQLVSAIYKKYPTMKTRSIFRG